ncbi:MAG: hypothetical protein GX023_10550 [Tissierellia bacterium]|nr:hypothetical protein [Tissierellia bacterium]
MDWSKAKTILIVAFIITNILLIYVFIGEKGIEEPTLKEDFIGNVEKLLKDKDIYLATEIPTDMPYLNTMNVSYENMTIDDLNRLFFENKGILVKDGDAFSQIVKEKESVVIINNKLILYENKNDEKTFKNIDRNQAIQIAEEFLKEKNIDTSDMELTFIKEENDTFYIEYSKLYNGVFVERAYTNFQIDGRGVKRFERVWLIVEDLGETEIYISTAPKAILALLDMEDVYGKTIENISLCYYFDPQKHDYLEEPGEAKQGKAIPAWRIQFQDGYKVFIDDY